MLDPVSTWVDEMLKKFKRGFNEAYDNILVMPFQPVQMRTSLILMAACFALGFFVSWRMDLAGFRDFRAKAAQLMRERVEENLLLAEALEDLRNRYDEEVKKREASDEGFENLLNKPGKTHCLVPVEDINPIIAEAGR